MGLLDYFRSSEEAAPPPPVKVGKSGKKICCSVSGTSTLIIDEDKRRQTMKTLFMTHLFLGSLFRGNTELQSTTDAVVITIE